MSLIVKCVKPLGQVAGLLIGFCAASGEQPYAFFCPGASEQLLAPSLASRPSGTGAGFTGAEGGDILVQLPHPA